MNTLTPESFRKRSFVYRQLSGAEFGELAGGAVAMELDGDSGQARSSGLLDLSLLPRCGFRGLNVSRLLDAEGLPVPSEPNRAAEASTGELVIRLSQKEFWVLAGLADRGQSVEDLKQSKLPATGCYPLYCQDSHAWFALTGNQLAQTMAKLCAVDLREEAFPAGAVVQTSAARINVIIVHHNLNGIPSFSIFCDSAAAEYLWQSLLDAMQESGGAPVGLNAVCG